MDSETLMKVGFIQCCIERRGGVDLEKIMSQEHKRQIIHIDVSLVYDKMVNVGVLDFSKVEICYPYIDDFVSDSTQKKIRDKLKTSDLVVVISCDEASMAVSRHEFNES